MGAFTSRRNADVEEVDISTTNAYRYPPKSGCYFGSHFIMGGEKFETTQPEAYLFGENADLNFLGGRPMPFPYPAPQASEPTKTLKSLVNIRKDSLRFVKAIDNVTPKKVREGGDTPKYNLEFTFDTDVRVAITVYYFATEEITNGQLVYHPRDATMNSETYHYKRGANQTFNQTTHIIEPNKFGEEEWQFNPDKEAIPVVVHCVVEEEIYSGHSHALLAYVERFTDGSYVLKPLKQKQMVDGLCYLLQEIYGIENKNRERTKLDDEIEDNGSECVICMCETRDTLILPCRHLCLCNMCADNLRYQANNCPICRSPFRALLQIRALRKKLPNSPTPQNDSSEENSLSQEGVPAGYEAVSMIEALNGPDVPTSPLPPTTQTNPPMGLPPDGDSPSMKRKGRRSSGRSSSRRNQKNIKPIQETRLQPPQDEVPEPAFTPPVMMVHIPESIDDRAIETPLQGATEPIVTSQQQQPLNIETSESLNDTPAVRLPSEPELTLPAEIDDCSTPQDYEQIKIEESDEDIVIDDPISDSTTIELDPNSTDSTNPLVVNADPDCLHSDTEKQLCLLQELSLPDGGHTDGSSGSSYSSTSSGKGLLDTDTQLPSMEQ